MESLVHYSNPSHALSVLGVLNEQRLRGQLCDTVLVVGEQKYPAHSCVLAASCEYFQSLFTRRDSEPHKVVVDLDFCEPDAFEIVLNYIYSSSLFVDKGSLAAIQELGYSLGIPFLTNIMSTTPHMSYCVSRKKLSFSEEDANDSQQRTVIVCKSRVDTPVPSSSSKFKGKTHQQTSHVLLETVSSPRYFRERSQQTSGDNKLNEAARGTAYIPRKPADVSNDTEMKSHASILSKTSHLALSVRPQLTTSVSFNEAQIQHVGLQTDSDLIPKDEMEAIYSLKPPFHSQTGEPSQTIDRSGPLIKSLLRRSLSMDSPVPVFSPTLELKDLQSREQSVAEQAVTKTEGKELSEHNKRTPMSQQKQTNVPPLVLGSRYHSRYDEEDDTQGEEVCVKIEPSSPLADPSEIIRITVGDSLPVNLKDFKIHFDQGPKPLFNLTGKRNLGADNRRYPFKMSRVINEHHLPLDDDKMPDSVQCNSNMDDEDYDKPRKSKMFKCWSCLKVFRSNAGLHRHVNMYHNPEKPYSCDICHKRFHTNFKVWTHSQTQHGVVQNPASSSSSSVLDEKFQKKLIDIVREREIKKALLMKLRRNKQGLPSQLYAKKRTRTHVCPYCGKTFVFQFHFKQHLKTHPAGSASDCEVEGERDLFQKQDQTVHQKENTGTEVHSCRLCNEKLTSLFEKDDHERVCRHATVCPYCGLRFSSPEVKKDHEAHCKYKKLTCLECMRTFKSSFSIWRHQVEVHNHNMMTIREQMSLSRGENNGEMLDNLQGLPQTEEVMEAGGSREDMVYSDSSGPPMYDSEDSSSFVPEDLSMGQHHGELIVKEEPMEEAVSERENAMMVTTANPEEPGVWPCEKCSNIFSSHKDLERHQELLCHIKPFICHICHKAFRTNFRLWSHFQSHMSTSDEPETRELDRQHSSPSLSPPLIPQVSGRPTPQSSPPKTDQERPETVVAVEEEEPGSSSMTKTKKPEMDRHDRSQSPQSRTDCVENPVGPQESDTLFYHAPSLSALTFKRQYMCKLCHRTFKTAFSLWSHEQSHNHL